MRQQDPEHNDRGNRDVVGEILHEVGDELAAVVAAPGEVTYKTLNRFFQFIGELSILIFQTLRYVLRGAIDFREMINQMAFIGVSSLPIVIITVAFSGAVLSLYMALYMVKWGIGSYTGGVVGIAITREIGPVLTAVVVTARAGSAIAAEVGSMKVTEQIDALRALAVSPIQYLMVPRLLAGLIMLPTLTIFGDVIGTYAGYHVAIINGVAQEGYINSLKTQVLPYDVVMGLVKTLFFALVIVAVAVQQGLQTSGGAAGVGKSTRTAVVISMVIIYISNFFLAYAMFGGRTSL